jgi:intracellular multiplication protein IcmE
MTEAGQPASAIDQHPQDAGFESEVAPAEDAAALTERRQTSEGARFRSEFSRNFNSVFGHGVGKIALIVGGIFIVVACAFAMRGFAHRSTQPQPEKVQVDIPRPPSPRVSVEPIDPREVQRRAQQAVREADVAQSKGQTYQPDFTPAVTRTSSAADLRFGSQPPIPGQDGQTQTAAVKPTPVPVSVTVPTSAASAQVNARLLAQEEQRRQLELDRQRAAREKYVEELRNGVKAQIQELIGERGGLHSAGGYSVVRYLPVERAVVAQSMADAHDGAAAPPVTPQSASLKRILFKAGKAIFATLDSEVNTDDGGDVFATIRGGAYDGSKLIGKIEQAPRNIRLRFSMLAPQDDRPTLAVNAIAIREQDAKEGVADSINHHTIERYSALFAGSLLQGLGQAAAQPQGSAIVLPNGQTVVEQQQLTNKRIALFAAGSVGTNAGAQVRQTFSEPPTYKTRANKGIGVVFLADVAEK